MPDNPTHSKFPEGSANCDYDVFEELQDGSTLWRACVFGMENVEHKLHELAHGSESKFFALNLHNPIQSVIRPVNPQSAQIHPREPRTAKQAPPRA